MRLSHILLGVVIVAILWSVHGWHPTQDDINSLCVGAAIGLVVSAMTSVSRR